MKPSKTGDQWRDANRAATGMLFLLCAFFILYQTAIPFRVDLTLSGLRHRGERSEWIPFMDNDGGLLSLADAAGNILLFVPFGFFLQHWRMLRRTREAGDNISVRPSLLAGLLYSGAIEILQLALDRRITSVNDLMMNFTGASIGVKLALAKPGLIGATRNKIRRIFDTRRLIVAWFTVLLAQTLIALPPFDFTLKQENFQRQILRWQYSWQNLASLWKTSANGIDLLQDFPHHRALAVTLLATGGCSILLGSFGLLCRRRYKSVSPRLIWIITLATLGFYPVLTLLQFTVQSARPFVLFPIVGIGGVILGMLFMLIVLQLGSKLKRHPQL
ncbi:MAG: VanZ family protein [candidate division KSB1 bacterium]|nr:VanZ family protein [candidate division KSB1 bacterium]MDZ7367038.1 VanZ family protein [candidate division KSB1 bacterium]MDZ7406738.1 VanZ family protein [candidate division KSB1 bacterium]